MISVAARLIAEPSALVKTTRNCLPLSASETVKAYVGDVADLPLRGQVVEKLVHEVRPPGVARAHEIPSREQARRQVGAGGICDSRCHESPGVAVNLHRDVRHRQAGCGSYESTGYSTAR